MTKVDKKILEELSRHNSINKYIMEQDAAVAADADTDVTDAEPEVGADPTIDNTPAAEPEVIDVNQDSEVEKISDSGEVESTEESSSEELDITDLVNSQKSMEEKQTEYFDSMFQQLNQLQSKLSEMDNLVSQLNSLEQKIEKYRPKTPEEKLELRSLDSGPFQQKLSDFFSDKQQEMEKTGKNEYVLTSDEVTNFTPSEISKTFDDYGSEPTGTKFKMN
jgi:hypothetical protein